MCSIKMHVWCVFEYFQTAQLWNYIQTTDTELSSSSNPSFHLHIFSFTSMYLISNYGTLKMALSYFLFVVRFPLCKTTHRCHIYLDRIDVFFWINIESFHSLQWYWERYELESCLNKASLLSFHIIANSFNY